MPSNIPGAPSFSKFRTVTSLDQHKIKLDIRFHFVVDRMGAFF